MTKQKSTKRALLMSALSLLMCVSMLIGSTFAWFTDSVTSNNNIIKSGNLDVELEYYDGDSWEKVTATTNVFEENTLWEPGHTEVVYLKVSNLGTLALKYNLGINIVNEVESVNVAGEALRLSDYIVFDAIEDVDTPYADRAAARAAVTEADVAKLSAGYTLPGEILAGEPAEYVALVVYMPESTGNEANYRTGEVAPEITLGINLMATQMTAEIDSFNNQYDAGAMFTGVPAARVTKLAKMPTVNNGTVTLDTAYVFEATEDADKAALNTHRYWHADFVATFDQDVPSAAVGLAGQYDYFSSEWLAFSLDGLFGGTIPANKQVRMLVNPEIGTNFPINYEELCSLVKKFSCGAFAVDKAAMAGVTMTVELRLYETEAPSASNGNSTNVETGKYEVIGSYSHTFAGVAVTNQAELEAAIANGASAVNLADGTYEIPAAAKGKTLTINGSDKAIIEHVNMGEDGMNYNLEGSTVTFNGVTIESASGTYRGFARSVAIEYNNCKFVGTYTLGAGSHTFKNCHFNLKNNYVWTWGGTNVVFDGCTFEDENGVAKAILVHNTVDTVVTVKDCNFVATTGAKTWDGIDVAAVSIDPNGAHTAKVIFEGTNDVAGAFNGKWQIKYSEDTALVTVVE